METGLKISKTNATESELPTFSHFLAYIISEPSGMNIHWKPYITCHPCHIQYDAIIKLETADEDTKLVMDMTGISQYSRFEKRHETKGGSSSNDQIRQKYFSQVSCQLLENVYEFYYMDFILFNYTTDGFYDLCSKSKVDLEYRTYTWKDLH